MTNSTKPGVSSLLALLIPLVAFAPLAGSAGPMFGYKPNPVPTGKATKQAQSRETRPAIFSAGSPFIGDFTSRDLDALTRSHGYFFSSSAQTLNAKGNTHTDSAGRLGRTVNSGSRSDSMFGLGNRDRDFGNGMHWDDGTSRLSGHTLADESISLDSIAQGLCGTAAPQKAPGKFSTNKAALSNACSGITDVDGGPTELVALAVQNLTVPEPSTGLLLLAVGLIGVGTRIKSTFRAPSGSV